MLLLKGDYTLLALVALCETGENDDADDEEDYCYYYC